MGNNCIKIVANVINRNFHFNDQKDRYEPSTGDRSTYWNRVKNETIQAVKQPAHGLLNIVSGAYDVLLGTATLNWSRVAKGRARIFGGAGQIILAPLRFAFSPFSAIKWNVISLLPADLPRLMIRAQVNRQRMVQLHRRRMVQLRREYKDQLRGLYGATRTRGHIPTRIEQLYRRTAS